VNFAEKEGSWVSEGLIGHLNAWEVTTAIGFERQKGWVLLVPERLCVRLKIFTREYHQVSSLSFKLNLSFTSQRSNRLLNRLSYFLLPHQMLPPINLNQIAINLLKFDIILKNTSHLAEKRSRFNHIWELDTFQSALQPLQLHPTPLQLLLRLLHNLINTIRRCD